MKLTETHIDSALHQIEAQAIPENHPATVQLGELFGDHTFFLDASGLAIIEPVKTDGVVEAMGRVVKLARWGDETRRNLAPHEPEYTDIVVTLDKAA
ncbi:hypothetical protein [Bosea sp. (in: a-proteobacteria)]|uniref:hypothetical protein n=1 Tax=Bosea sp. (in: a-proteobacteria) TaxID=1871050 RepID=UPI002DDC9CAE|nr:hypothetical protein [Bosea sp. (in: a-proteobacteria)]HEV2510163.1 hypothetical protein [Bosea sp. (in: a-proteobacteria)]